MLNLDGNSGPYLQYTYARTQSVLGKLKTQNSKLKTKSQNEKPEKILDSSFGFDLCALTFEINSEELSLLRAIYRFPEAVLEATQNYAPNLICNYLYDLAQKFNFFYHKHRILESDQQDFRLVLTMATGQVLKNGLTLLGIAAPERM
jgi:arginyl-tRNA synthetase